MQIFQLLLKMQVFPLCSQYRLLEMAPTEVQMKELSKKPFHLLQLDATALSHLLWIALDDP